jgi:hypothetical protein
MERASEEQLRKPVKTPLGEAADAVSQKQRQEKDAIPLLPLFLTITLEANCTALRHWTSSLDEANYQHHNCNHQQDMDEAPQGVRTDHSE